ATTTTTAIAARPRPDYRDGVLTVDGRRYVVGRPGDHLLVGDWGCGGDVSLALFRPQTGEVFAFDWPSPGVHASVTAAATVAGATAAAVRDADGDGCEEIVVERRDGPPAVVRLTPGAAPPRSPTAVPRP